MASFLLRLFIIFSTAVILAKIVWWIFVPTNPDVYVESANFDQQDKITSYIVNRYPFGVVAVAAAEDKPKPSIISQLKLTGVYLNTDSDSFAFVTYQDKSLVIRQSESIADTGLILKQVRTDSIVVTMNNSDSIINLDPLQLGGNLRNGGVNETLGGEKITAYHNSIISNYADSNIVTNNNSMNGNNNLSPKSNSVAGNNGGDMSNFKEQRIRLINDFVKRNNQTNASSGVITASSPRS